MRNGAGEHERETGKKTSIPITVRWASWVMCLWTPTYCGDLAGWGVLRPGVGVIRFGVRGNMRGKRARKPAFLLLWGWYFGVLGGGSVFGGPLGSACWHDGVVICFNVQRCGRTWKRDGEENQYSYHCQVRVFVVCWLDGVSPASLVQGS